MTTLVWNSVGERYFEIGNDRGVLYPKVGNGVAWNGLVSVSESPTGADPRPYYTDGFKYLNLATAEEFEATIEAFSAPYEFGRCDGTISLHNGLFITQQPRESFGFSYRTKIGNDLDGVDHGYKIHLVYNALAAPSERSNTTMSDSSEPVTFSWHITTAPVQIAMYKPSAHFVIDSRKTPKVMLDLIEGILYGNNSYESRLPTVDEIITMFDSFVALRAALVEAGVYTIYEVDDISNAAAVMSPTAPDPLTNGDPLLWFDTSTPGYVTLKLITGA